jgi:hypothetical protein
MVRSTSSAQKQSVRPGWRPLYPTDGFRIDGFRIKVPRRDLRYMPSPGS